MTTQVSNTNHEEAFVAAFIVPEKRERYAAFLANAKRRCEITDRFCHFFDFVPSCAAKTGTRLAADLVQLLRRRGAGDTAHVIGGRKEIDGVDLPLAQAIDAALADPSGVVVSCLPGRLALLIQEFPPGETYILSHD